MATRATYQFINELADTYTVYIHHDGDPEGAANYFKNGDALIFDINDFIRANDAAEMTRSHEIHGDTDYRYTVEGTRIIAEESVNFTDKFETFFDGSVAVFVQQYSY